MNDLVEFKRMNFFKGFFTTAEDWNQGQSYAIEKRKLHNRGLHTPGVVEGEGQELRVEAAGGLDVRVLPGAALDGAGNDIYLGEPRTLTVVPPDNLPQLVYVAIKYAEEKVDYVENVQAPHFSGHTRWAEIPSLQVVTTRPDNQTWLELARVDLQPGVTEIATPSDPDSPGGNEIDLRYVVRAGSVGVAEPRLSPAMRERLILLAQDKRRDFAALGGRFPVPSAGDVRHAALTVEMLVRTDCLRPEPLPRLLAAIAALEQDVGQEIEAAYPAVITTAEFTAYRDAVAALLDALRDGMGLDTLLARQGAVAEAARELSEVALQPPEPPIADAGPDRVVLTSGKTAITTLDATSSQAFEGRKIERYRWEKKE